MEDLSSFVIAFRLIERAAVSVIVIVISLVVIVGFWKPLQKIDFRLNRGDISSGGTFVLATPVLEMIALIGFSWVNFSNPISYEGPATSLPVETATTMAVAPSGVSFRASSPDPGAQDLATRRANVRQTIRVLNCAAGRPATLTDALAKARLSLMRSVWDPEWGDADAFENWALYRANNPDREAQAFFEEKQDPC